MWNVQVRELEKKQIKENTNGIETVKVLLITPY